MTNNSSQAIAGVTADVAAGVTIGTVFSGYFNSDAAATALCEQAIGPLLDSLDETVDCADFGGGDGYLLWSVCQYLSAHGKRPNGTVVDMNPSYLERASERGLKTLKVGLAEADIAQLDLAIARAVLHYNSLDAQRLIVANIFRSLRPGGFFVHSPSSGDAANCALRTDIAALPSLGRTTGEGKVHFITPETYMTMAQDAGFEHTSLVGYAPDNSWTLTEMFTRFNPTPEQEDDDYRARQQHFLDEALLVAKKYRDESSIEGLELYDNDARVTYRYPIFVSKKA